MARPGTQINLVDDAPPGGAILDTGQAFFTGVAEKGSTTSYETVHTVGEYEDKLGSRAGGTVLYDSVGAFFAEGGTTAYIARVGGTGQAVATIALGSGLKADASSPGTWANGLKVSAEAPATSLTLVQASVTVDRADVPEGTVAEVLAWVGDDPARARAAADAENESDSPRQSLLDGLAEAEAGSPEQQAAGDPVQIVVRDAANNALERSPTVASQQEAVDWSKGALDVRLSITTPGLLPVAGTTATLAGGANAAGAPIDTDLAAALARFDYALGPGQVCAPGFTTSAMHTVVCAHCDATRRVCLLDLPNNSDPTALAASVTALKGKPGVRFASAWAPWVQYPGPAGSVVTIPFSGIEAGLIARSDLQGNPNQPAAGMNGISRLALSLDKDYTDAQREALNLAGACMAKVRYGTVRSYGYRTAAGPADTNWTWFGNSRTVMAISHEADAIAENYVLRQIDGRGHIFQQLKTDLVGMLMRYYSADALFGATSDEAFSVDVGPQVNTAATIAAGEVHAVIRVKCSPAAEWVVIDIVKVPIERAIAA